MDAYGRDLCVSAVDHCRWLFISPKLVRRDALGAMRAQQTAARRDELAICAQVSLRYEMPYLLSWVAYHTLLGFDRILLYLDDLKHLGALDERKQACCAGSGRRVGSSRDSSVLAMPVVPVH